MIVTPRAFAAALARELVVLVLVVGAIVGASWVATH